MNQAAHIFSKDARHLRWEIGISLALFAAWLWAAPVEWRPALYPDPMGMSISDVQKLVGGLTSLLVPVSWWLLITRLVQDENLVGTQQWWITKPYEWPSLLAGKLFFLGAFIFAPILIVQAVILAEGGFSPLAHAPGLISSLALFLTFVVLPLMAIAAVTSTFARATLVILAVFVAALILGVGLAIRLAFGSFIVPWIGWLITAIVLIGGVAVIVWQYARRYALPARLAMIAVALLVVASMALSANPLSMSLTYPRVSTGIQIAQVPPPQPGTTGHTYSQFAGMGRVGVGIPVQVSGLAPNDALSFDGAQVSVEAPDGRRWSSSWEALSGPMILATTDPSSIPPVPVQIDAGFYKAEKNDPITVHLRLAVSALQSASPLHLALPAQQFTVPDFGICTPIPSTEGAGFRDLHCRAPLRHPAKTLVEVQWSDEPCSVPSAGRTTIHGEEWTGVETQVPAEFGLNSIQGLNLQLSNNSRISNNRYYQRFLCPGSPVDFTAYHLSRRFEYDLTVTGYHMPGMGPIPGMAYALPM